MRVRTDFLYVGDESEDKESLERRECRKSHDTFEVVSCVTKEMPFVIISIEIVNYEACGECEITHAKKWTDSIVWWGTKSERKMIDDFPMIFNYLIDRCGKPFGKPFSHIQKKNNIGKNRRVTDFTKMFIPVRIVLKGNTFSPSSFFFKAKLVILRCISGRVISASEVNVKTPRRSFDHI